LALRLEMLVRGYKPNYVQPPVVELPPEWWGNWEPDEAAMQLNRERILERKTA
jgi:hypothetical protein